MMTETPPLLHPYRFLAADPAEVVHLDGGELRRALLLPHKVIDLVLVQRNRFSRTVADARHLGVLTAMMLLTTIVLALPFGAALGLDRVWRVAALLLGSVLICFPSLHVFSSYLGCRMSLAQNLVLALMASAVAAIFLLGFAPIAWFISATTPADSATASRVALALLVTAIAAGIVHLSRCVMGDAGLRPPGRYQLLMVLWQGLFAYVSYRMGEFLGLP